VLFTRIRAVEWQIIAIGDKVIKVDINHSIFMGLVGGQWSGGGSRKRLLLQKERRR